jgi:predicted HicB family RNase H-like nuclease
MSYKKLSGSFFGSVEFSKEDNCYHGKITNIGKDLVTYEAKSRQELTEAFQDAVNDYIETCTRTGFLL